MIDGSQTFQQICRLLLGYIIKGLQNDALTAPKGKVNLMIFHFDRNRCDISIKGIEEECALEING